MIIQVTLKLNLQLLKVISKSCSPGGDMAKLFNIQLLQRILEKFQLLAMFVLFSAIEVCLPPIFDN